MADGMLCIHCGKQEMEHKFVAKGNFFFTSKEEARKCLPGKNVSLFECVESGKGFVPENPKLAEELAIKAIREEEEGRRGIMFDSEDYDD